jgi:hypothetical protein
MTKKHAIAGNNAEWSKSTGAGQFSGDVIFFSSVALASHAREKDRSFGPDRSPDGKYFPFYKPKTNGCIWILDALD